MDNIKIEIMQSIDHEGWDSDNWGTLSVYKVGKLVTLQHVCAGAHESDL